MASKKKVSKDQVTEQLKQIGESFITRPTSDHKVIYANSNRMGVSPWDIRITFGQMSEVFGEGAVNEEMLTVVMSPQLAKVTMHSLISTIKQYEGMFGEIPDLGGIVKLAKDANAKS